ncbi:MAG: hypothetical protein Q7S56_03835 [Nanoarchaeota archaeon]|nr:hypothetical protein [Nanoarchaeota archaeon]
MDDRLIGIVIILFLVGGIFIFKAPRPNINLQTEDDAKEFAMNYADKHNEGLWIAFKSDRSSEIDISEDSDGDWVLVSIFNDQIVHLVIDKKGNIIREPRYKSI